MINYQVFGLVGWLKLLEQERRIMGEKLQMLAVLRTIPAEAAREIPPGTWMVTDGDKERLKNRLEYATTKICGRLTLESTNNRVERFQRRLAGPALTPLELSNELQTLYDALEDDLRYKYFYFYPDAKAKTLLRTDADWAPAFKKFWSIKDSAKAAVDCYALGHNAACVFHCMMVLESGLKALASDVELSFETQQWHNILEEIESKIAGLRKTLRQGTEKSRRLQFLSEAAKEFFYFKDGWRNYVSHGRAAYDEYQAQGALEHVRAFMIHLATRLSE